MSFVSIPKTRSGKSRTCSTSRLSASKSKTRQSRSSSRGVSKRTCSQTGTGSRSAQGSGIHVRPGPTKKWLPVTKASKTGSGKTKTGSSSRLSGTKSSARSLEIIAISHGQPVTTKSRKSRSSSRGACMLTACQTARSLVLEPPNSANILSASKSRTRSRSSSRSISTGSATTLPTRNSHTTPLTAACLRTTTYPSSRRSSVSSAITLPTRNSHTTPLTAACLKSTTYPSARRSSVSQSYLSKLKSRSRTGSTQFSATPSVRSNFKTFVPSPSATGTSVTPSMSGTCWGPTSRSVTPQMMSQTPQQEHVIVIEEPDAPAKKDDSCKKIVWLIIILCFALFVGLIILRVFSTEESDHKDSSDDSSSSKKKKKKKKKIKPPPTIPTDPKIPSGERKPNQILASDCDTYTGALPNERLCGRCFQETNKSGSDKELLQTKILLRRRKILQEHGGLVQAQMCAVCGKGVAGGGNKMMERHNRPSMFSSKFAATEYNDQLANHGFDNSLDDTLYDTSPQKSVFAPGGCNRINSR